MLEGNCDVAGERGGEMNIFILIHSYNNFHRNNIY